MIYLIYFFDGFKKNYMPTNYIMRVIIYIDKIIYFIYNIIRKKGGIMNKNLINLTPEDILNKEFKIDTRGYRLKEVDQFLDVIIADYQAFNKIILDLQKEREEQIEEILKLKQEIRDLKTSVEISRSSLNNNDNMNNLDILKRLSQLEKIVYGKDE